MFIHRTILRQMVLIGWYRVIIDITNLSLEMHSTMHSEIEFYSVDVNL